MELEFNYKSTSDKDPEWSRASVDYVRRRLFPHLVPGALDKFAHLDDTGGPLGGGSGSGDPEDPSEILCRARVLLSARNTGAKSSTPCI